MALALTGRQPAEIFFSAKFSLPRKKLPYPAVIFDGQLKTRKRGRYKLPTLSCSAYGAICCHLFKPNASLSVGQSYKDFYIRKP
jgi:hypothetical protein